MVNIFISGYYGLDNIGDEAILSGMISSLKKSLNNPTFTVLTNNALCTQSLHNVNPVEHSLKKGSKSFLKNIIVKNEIGNIVKEINKCDIFILGGGSLLQDLKAYYLPVLYSQLKIASVLKKKTVIYGIGAGPIDTRFGKTLSRSILNKIDLVTVRDGMSKQVLESCGVQNVIQTADPAFGIDIPNRDILDNYCKSMDINLGERYIASTAYNWLHDSDISRNATSESQDLQNRRARISNLFESVINKNNRKILFVPTVKIDREGYSAIKNLMPSSERTKVLDYNTDFNAVFAALSCSDVLIGMRLHSLILATIMGVPVVPISYCGKGKSYLELIGLEDLYLDVENLLTENFAKQFSDNFDLVWKNQTFYAEKQQKAAEQLRQKAFLNAKLAAELVT